MSKPQPQLSKQSNLGRRLACVLVMAVLVLMAGAQPRPLPSQFQNFMSSPGMSHATVTFELLRLPTTSSPQAPTIAQPAVSRGQVIYSYDAERMVAPASVMKLLTAATGFRLLGADYVWPDSIGMIDTAAVALPGLERYNPDWLIEDIDTDYMPPLDNVLPDSGRVLSDVMHETLLKSLNLQAETMLCLLTPSCRRDSAIECVRQYWEQRGLDMESLVMYDGSGLSPNDRVTAHLMNSLLADMQFDSDYRRAIAIAGREGTVRRFFRDTRLDGKAWLKTGTLKNVLAYAGYIEGSDGKTYAMSIFVSNSTCRHADLRKRIEKLLLSLIP